MWQIYRRLIAARLHAQLEYRGALALQLLGFLGIMATEFAVMAILLSRFGTVAGWTLPEVAVLFGLAQIAFSLAEMVARGFDSPFEALILRGGFDVLIVRPLNAFVQVLASEFQLRRLARTITGLLVLGYAGWQAPIAWQPWHALLLPLTILSGATIYTALVVLGATLCFWTIKTPEVINIFTSGGVTMSAYPLEIYTNWVRTVFLMIVPVAFTCYPAALLLLGRTDPLGLPAGSAWAAPLVAGAFFGLALAIWRQGVLHYQSSGS